MTGLWMLSLCVLALFGAACVPAVSCENASSTAPSSLQLLLVVYRHGERTPIVTCPSDVNTPRFLTAGIGQLTTEGMRMHYELGRFLRRRYTGFLHERYHHNYTEVRAANYDRTLMSAQANLAALYPPRADELFHEGLSWRPIPVHTRPLLEDYELEFPDACARYRQLLEQLKRSHEIQRVLRYYSELFDIISQHCGVTVTTLEDGMFIYDLFDIERRMNLTLPAWASTHVASLNATLFPDALIDVYRKSFEMLSYTPQLRRLGGAALLAQLMRHINESVTGVLSPPQRQLFVYSGHDSDLAALQATLGVYNGIPPPLASCIMLELHHTTSTGHFMRIWYRNSTRHQPRLLTVPACSQADCPWSSFIDHFQSLVPADIATECRVPADSLSSSDSVLVVLAVLLALILTVIAAFGATRCYHKCRVCLLNSSSSYSMLIDD